MRYIEDSEPLELDPHLGQFSLAESDQAPIPLELDLYLGQFSSAEMDQASVLTTQSATVCARGKAFTNYGQNKMTRIKTAQE